jgi:hypothetical protein
MTEKRQFFRIQQDVIFNFKAVSTDEVTHVCAEQHFDHANALSLISQFQQLDNDSHKLLENIQQENSDVAKYLDVLNQKLNRLSQQLLANEAVAVNDSENGRIDLSLGGIGFTSDSPHGIESWLAVKLVFVPSYVGLVTYTQVTRNLLQEDGSHLIGARFHQLNEEHQRVLSRQMMQTQLAEKELHSKEIQH